MNLINEACQSLTLHVESTLLIMGMHFIQREIIQYQCHFLSAEADVQIWEKAMPWQIILWSEI